MLGWVTQKPDKNIRIDIGSGNPAEDESHPEGLLLQDIEPFKGIDLVCDIRDLDKYIGKGECSFIRASHVIEHFGKDEVAVILKMLHDLLEDGGEFGILVPNFLYHAQLAMKGLEYAAIDYCFGEQKDQYDYHKTGFTPQILHDSLKKAGFSVVEIKAHTSIAGMCKK